MADETENPGLAAAGYTEIDGEAAARANRDWWSANAEEYIDEHGRTLGDVDFLWCPEGLRESQARLLGDVRGRRVLEVGAGAAQCSRWLRTQGADVVATDVSRGMLAQAARLDAITGLTVPSLIADARELPFADGSFDTAFTAFGAIPFVPDPQRIHVEVARVLRPGGRWVFAMVHPMRWGFPDDPTRAGLLMRRSYFDRTPYVETDAAGRPLYAEFHHTIGDHLRHIRRAGLVVEDLVEPEWPDGHDEVWGAWGPERGAYLPGTLIVVTTLP